MSTAVRKDCTRCDVRPASSRPGEPRDSPRTKREGDMSANDVLTVAAAGGVIGDGRTAANLALGVGLIGVAFGWLALARVSGRISTGEGSVAMSPRCDQAWATQGGTLVPYCTRVPKELLHLCRAAKGVLVLYMLA
ncbi:DUF6223 family protein [Streptomyces sp. NPDC008141]|uniref:DUF6223 family protein n=1 Tax=Streptomyces sp. NPDC008141 TaxID=3364815 RepID=UPI0036E7B1B9